jgi:hypothetical protein
MKIRSPIVTLLVGAGLAAVLLVLDARASSDAQEKAAAAAAAAPTATASATASSPSAPTTPAATSAPAATTAPVSTKPVTYAGHLKRSGSVAVVVRGNQAVAYMCDSANRVEAWMRGSADGGKVNLSGHHGAQLTGTVTGSRLTGTVKVEDMRWTYSVKSVRPPSGLYRASAKVRGAQVIGGWIVLDDGTQVGLTSTGEEGEHPEPAPSLDTSTRSVTVDGVTLNPAPVDPATFE